MAALAPSPTCTVQLPLGLLSDVREFLSDYEKVNFTGIEDFVEKAVRNYLVIEATRRLQEEMAPHIAHLSDDEFMAEIDEVLAEVRAEMRAAE